MKRLSICCRIVILSCALWVASCTVQSNQLSLLASLAKQKQDSLASYRWRVEFGRYEAIVFAVTTPEGTLFVNYDDDKILFDGWMITEVQGLGQSSVISVQGLTGERLLRKDSSRVGSQKCEKYRLLQDSNSSMHAQYCFDSERHRNQITLDTSGAITKIEQYLGLKELNEWPSIVLTRL